MNNSQTDVEVDIPFRQTNSSLQAEPEQYATVTPCISALNILRDTCHTFLNVTTVRGARNIVDQYGILRRFWIFFILLSFALLTTVAVFCIKSYTSYHTVMRHHKRLIYGKDFPTITICSDGLFGDTEAIRMFANHPLAYDRILTAKLSDLMRKGDYRGLKNFSPLRSMVYYNVNNFAIMKQLLEEELKDRHMKDFDILPRLLTDIKCLIDSGNRCNIFPFINLKYRNCLSFQVPRRLYDTHFQEIVINGLLLSDKDPNILPQLFSVTGTFLSGRQLHFYLHQSNTLPRPHPDFVISMTTDKWVLINFDATLLQRSITPVSKCAELSVGNTTHAGESIRLSPHVCRQLKVRRVIRERCGCEFIEPPFDIWPVDGTHFCGRWGASLMNATNEIECMYTAAFTVSPDDKSDCEVPCSEMLYRSRLNVNGLQSRTLNRIAREDEIAGLMVEVKKNCERKVDSKCNNFRTVLHELVTNESINVDDYRSVDPSFKTENSSRDYWKNAMPNKTVDSSKRKLEKTKFIITIRSPRKYVVIETEYIVHTFWTTLAQLGGASSFLAGLTFSVIGEIVDTIFKMYLKHRNN